MREIKGNLNKSFYWQYNPTTMQGYVQQLFEVKLDDYFAAFPNLQGKGGRVNGFLNLMNLQTWIRSLDIAILPNLERTDSETNKLNKTLTYEWQSPRFHIKIWLTNNPNPKRNEDWTLKAEQSIIRPDIYPYREYDLYDQLSRNITRPLAQGDKLGVSLLALNWGYPNPELDDITIDGSYSLSYLNYEDDPQPVIIYLGTTSSGTSSSSSTPTITSPPKVTLSLPSSYSGDLYVMDDVDVTYTITNLTASANFTLQWLIGDSLIGSPATLQADNTGAYTGSIKSSRFLTSPYGTPGLYKVRVLQGQIGADSNTINVIQPLVSFKVPGTTGDITRVNRASGESFEILFANIKAGVSFNYQWMKGGVLVGNSYAQIANNLNHRLAWNSQNLYNVSGDGIYKVRLSKGSYYIDSSASIEVFNQSTGGYSF